MKRSLFVLALVLGLGLGQAAEHTKDTPADVKKALADGKAVLIDVRELSEWNDGHLKDAKSVPLSDIKAGKAADRLKELIPSGKIAYLHCAAGGRCLKAAEFLKDKGYEIRPLKPGYEALLKDGFEKAK